MIYEVGEHEGMPYMVLEYLEGKTLRRVMARTAQALPTSRVVELDAAGRARARARARARHRPPRSQARRTSSSPSAGTVKVLDFGIAKALARQTSRQARRLRRASSQRA